MKIKLILFAFLVLVSAEYFSQDTLVMYRKGSLWGFINLKGEVVIEAKFTSCKGFNSGLAKIGVDKFVRVNGDIFYVRDFVKKNLLKVREFSDGLLGVKVSKYWGYINTDGDLVIPAKYKYITDFIDGYAAARTKEGFFIIDTKGIESRVGLDRKKKISYIKKFSEGLAPVESADHWGFVNQKGEIVVEVKFSGVGYFKGGLAWVRTKEGKVGYINKSGDWIIKPIFVVAKDFDVVSGLAKIKGEGIRQGYVNIEGKVIQFENTRDHQRYFDGMCRDTKQMGNAKIGYLNNKGEWAIEPAFGIAGHFNHGYAIVREKGKWGVINKKGELIIEPKYGYLKGVYPID
jgi:hypothetical protein